MDSHIKSFVLRKGRMTTGQKKAFDLLSPEYCIKPSEKTDFKSFFKNTAPLYLEIGFGMGDATWQIAQEHPSHNYICIEVFPPGIGKLLSVISEKGIENIRIIEGDAVMVLETICKNNVFSGIHIFFPDPWPKKRHWKRRLVKPGFISLCTKKLKKDGYLYIVSDWKDYAEEMLLALLQEKYLVNKYNGFAAPQHWRPETSFERKGLIKQHDIRELYFIKT